MEVNVETTGSSLAQVTFSVPAEEFQREFRGGLQQLGRRVRMKGFRPGKVPLHVVEKQFGKQVRDDLMEQFLRRAYQQAIAQRELKPLSHPRVPRETMDLGEDGSFGLAFEISLRPDFELPEYKGLAIESELEPILDEQVDQVVADLRRQESVPEPAGDEGIDENGVLLCDVAFRRGEVEEFRREGLRLAAHTPPPGIDPEAFAQAIVGAKDGGVIELDMVLPANLPNEEARGQAGTCRLEVRQAFRMVPPSDEDLYKKTEVEDEQALRAKVRARLEDISRKREDNRVETVLLDRVIAATPFELPPPLLLEQTEHRLQQLAQKMRQSGVPEEEIPAQVEQQRSVAAEEADKGMRALLVVEALGEKEALLVTNEELEAELSAIAARNDASIEEVREYYVKNNLGQQMAIEVLERKVRAFLRASAQVQAPA